MFSTKRYAPFHVLLQLGNVDMDRKWSTNIYWDVSRLKISFQSHIKEDILKERRGIGVLKYVSKYLSRNIVDQVNKSFVKPDLDYSDIIYHRYDQDMKLNVTK